MPNPIRAMTWMLCALFLNGCKTTIASQEVQPMPVVDGTTAIKGEVTMIAGIFYLTRDTEGQEILRSTDKIYTVKQDSGLEVQVTVDEATRIGLEHRVTTLDRIEATVLPDGRALAIKPADQPFEKPK